MAAAASAMVARSARTTRWAGVVASATTATGVAGSRPCAIRIRPILGALFRSSSYRRNETELVVIVTPYLVRPASHQLATPTDGYRAPGDLERVFLGQSAAGRSGATEPTAIAAPAVPAPGFKL